jgi:hypothetical protein
MGLSSEEVKEERGDRKRGEQGAPRRSVIFGWNVG